MCDETPNLPLNREESLRRSVQLNLNITNNSSTPLDVLARLATLGNGDLEPRRLVYALCTYPPLNLDFCNESRERRPDLRANVQLYRAHISSYNQRQKLRVRCCTASHDHKITECVRAIS